MDMEMDIPQPEELELLEANSHFEDEEEDSYPEIHPPDEDDDKQTPQLTTSTAEFLKFIDPQINNHKRSRSPTPHPPNQLEIDEKRSKLAAKLDGEDWLRYSPPLLEEDSLAAEIEPKETTLSRYASEIDGDCVPITAPGSGERVYAKICRIDTEEIPKGLNVNGRTGVLVSESINVLLQRSEQEAFTKALQATLQGPSIISLPENPVVREQLWVDKYAPNSFTDLLSDEQTNREVLLWLKQWDSCVFGSEIRSTSDEVLSALRRHSTTLQHQKHSNLTFTKNGSNKGYKGSNGSSNQWYKGSNGDSRYSNDLDLKHSKSGSIQDSWNKRTKLTGPPEQKILLLCGAPGLGKTTLAHVAAKHCGYRVVEVNASDERQSSAVEAKILDVVQMNSVTADARPKCLVIDEIDGALGEGKGAVEAILKMVSADKKRDIGKENVANEQSGRTSSKKERRTTSLSRPVICICNDLYAPALRRLRQVAKVHIFVQPTVSRVVSRLKHICHKEGMKTSSFSLSALAEYTECDVRSCLNTLQFLNKKKENLNVMEISSQVIGRKDISRSVFDIWKEIFHKRKLKRERNSNDSDSCMAIRFNFLHSLISNRGDYDLVFDGIHENILQLHFHDPVMQKMVQCLDNLGTSDMLHNYIMRTQAMPLYGHFPTLAILIHHVVRQTQKPNIEWPKSYQRYRTSMMEKLDTLRSWRHKIPPHIGRHLSTNSFVEDSISPLLHILSPLSLRPVALHLLSDKEKDHMAHLVSTMVSYSITYKNTKCDSPSNTLGQEAGLDAPMLSFDPPISDFIDFKGHKSSHHVLALVMKQVLLHEVEKQKILQTKVEKPAHLNYEGNKGTQNLLRKQDKKVPFETNNPVAAHAEINKRENVSIQGQGSLTVQSNQSSRESTVTSLMLKAPGSLKKPCKRINFFERFTKSNKSSTADDGDGLTKTTTCRRDSRPLLFKFNEGYTNAVKRPVRMVEFMS